MTLEYTLLLAAIGIPIIMLVMRMITALGLLYEISASLWMLPI
jgi:membrane-bound ClpP family serine protease